MKKRSSKGEIMFGFFSVPQYVLIYITRVLVLTYMQVSLSSINYVIESNTIVLVSLIDSSKGVSIACEMTACALHSVLMFLELVLHYFFNKLRFLHVDGSCPHNNSVSQVSLNNY